MYHPSVALHGDAHARPGNLVSNGAYKLQDWQVGSYIEIVRNDYYWDNEHTAIDRVRHYVTPDDSVELSRYRAGELDITFSVPSEAFAQMRRERPNELRVSPYLAVYYYGFNLTKPPFKDNPKLRQALSMAIDRETLTEQVTVGCHRVPTITNPVNFSTRTCRRTSGMRKRASFTGRPVTARTILSVWKFAITPRMSTAGSHLPCSRCGRRCSVSSRL
jgi:ABC-type oligopeptide transport system substrate-binding subunit